MGILRFILAISVVAAHAGYIAFPLPDEKPYPVWAMSLIEGRNSVALFYIISGFYMAMILNNKYKEVWKFYKNRFLRLWPTYITVAILTFFFVGTIQEIINLTKNFDLATKAYIWFSNIFILGTDTFWLVNFNPDSTISYLPAFINPNSNGHNFLINAPSFSISIELFFYLMAPFILTSVKRTWAYFILGALYNVYVVLSGNINIIYTYHLIPSSFLYFGLGALAWHYTYNVKFELNDWKTVLLFLGCLGLMFFYTLYPMVIILCFTVMIPRLFELTKKSRVDRFIGELSYPIYIIHYPVIAYLQGHQVDQKFSGIYCLLLTLGLALFIHFLVERPIDKIRQKGVSPLNPELAA